MSDAAELGAGTHRILLIEDNAGDARLVSLMLGEGAEGLFELQHVDRLDAAWDCLPGAGCVLVDLSLPDADGLEAVERLQLLAPEQIGRAHV